MNAQRRRWSDQAQAPEVKMQRAGDVAAGKLLHRP
jgi:hypothetical protein